MFRLLTVVFFALLASVAHADDLEDADKEWSPGKPWPAHWGLITYPYQEAWNTVLVAFVNKVYGADEAADTWVKDIPYARQRDAAVEICVFKRGLFKLATHCKVAVVDPEIRGTLQKNDLVALFYPNHGTKRFSRGPGSDARTTMRVFQKLSTGDDPACWESVLMISGPTAAVCRDRIDRNQVSRLLTRDFGPRAGGDHINSVATPTETAYGVGPTKPSPDTSLSAPAPTVGDQSSLQVQAKHAPTTVDQNNPEVQVKQAPTALDQGSPEARAKSESL